MAKAKTEKWYKFSFADGTYCICRGMSHGERASEERKHGKILSKVLYAVYPA